MIAAKLTGRRFLGFEINEEYVAVTNERLKEVQAQKVLELSPEPVGLEAWTNE